MIVNGERVLASTLVAESNDAAVRHAAAAALRHVGRGGHDQLDGTGVSVAVRYVPPLDRRHDYRFAVYDNQTGRPATGTVTARCYDEAVRHATTTALHQFGYARTDVTLDDLGLRLAVGSASIAAA